MAEPFLGEIRIMSFGYNPRGWAMANGQLLPINQNQALFSLLGTTYGGNGQTNFALPDLRGNVPIKFGSGHTQGEKGGSQSVTLSISQMPTHTHVASANNTPPTAPGPSPAGTRMVSQSAGANVYGTPSNAQAMAPNSISSTGGSQAHLNMQPFLVLNFCIALQGIFPSQN